MSALPTVAAIHLARVTAVPKTHAAHKTQPESMLPAPPAPLPVLHPVLQLPAVLLSSTASEALLPPPPLDPHPLAQAQALAPARAVPRQPLRLDAAMVLPLCLQVSLLDLP